MKHHHRHENDCLNCGTELNGHFCHLCGQENLHVKEPFWHFLSHSISHYFHFDEKFFNTIIPLLAKPGEVTLAYLAGKRTKYLQPVSMYIFVSIVYFLIIPPLQRKVDKDDDSDTPVVVAAKATSGSIDSLNKAKRALAATPMPDVAQKAAQEGLNKTIANLQTKSFKELPFARQTVVLDSLKNVVKQHPNDSLQDVVDYYGNAHADREDSTYNAYLKRQARLPADERDNFFTRFKKRRDIEIKQRTNNEWSMDKEIEHYQPKLYFILMPLFAFFLMLSFRKNHRYYVEHIVFTIHFFTAFFIFQLVAVPINHFIFNDSQLFNWLCYAAIAWYAYTALRVFYQRSKGVTIGKMIILGACYSIAFGISYEIIYQIVYMLA